MNKNKDIKKRLPNVNIGPVTSFNLNTDALGFACITLNDGENKIRVTLSNKQCREIARNLRGIANSNGNNNKTP